MGVGPDEHMQTLFRLLLVAGLVAAAAASIADRVVPEEQFYDQASEQEISDGEEPLLVLLDRASGGGGRGKSGRGGGRGRGRSRSRNRSLKDGNRRAPTRDSGVFKTQAKGGSRSIITGGCTSDSSGAAPSADCAPWRSRKWMEYQRGKNKGQAPPSNPAVRISYVDSLVNNANDSGEKMFYNEKDMMEYCTLFEGCLGYYTVNNRWRGLASMSGNRADFWFTGHHGLTVRKKVVTAATPAPAPAPPTGRRTKIAAPHQQCVSAPADENSCKQACNSQGFKGSWLVSTWNGFNRGCFITVTGGNKGNCHWNRYTGNLLPHAIYRQLCYAGSPAPAPPAPAPSGVYYDNALVDKADDSGEPMFYNEADVRFYCDQKATCLGFYSLKPPRGNQYWRGLHAGSRVRFWYSGHHGLIVQKKV